MKARPGACRDSSMAFTVPHSGIAEGVISVHVAPSSREMCTRPSSVPAHSRPRSCGETSKAKIVP